MPVPVRVCVWHLVTLKGPEERKSDEGERHVFVAFCPEWWRPPWRVGGVGFGAYVMRAAEGG